MSTNQEERRKKAWSTPHLTVYGDIEKITQQGQGKAKGKLDGSFDAVSLTPPGLSDIS
jgi:hypothetical protein